MPDINLRGIKKRDDGNAAFTHSYCSARVHSDFASDPVDTFNAAFPGRWSRMEMYQIGVNPDYLRAPAQCPVGAGLLGLNGETKAALAHPIIGGRGLHQRLLVGSESSV